MARLFLVDGYNVLHFSTLLRPLADTDFEAARDALIDKLSRYCSITGSDVRIVFDGRGRALQRRAPEGLSTNLKVMFSPHDQSADSVIERAVYKSTDRRSITVVSGDRGIRNLCMGLGSPTISPDTFLGMVREAVGALSRELDREQSIVKPMTVEDRLDADAVEQLRRLKERLRNT